MHVRLGRGERGAALVEFALVLPVFAMLVFGGFSGAMAYNRKQSIVYAAREGARYGATVPQSQCSPTSNCGGKTWAQLVQSVVVARSGGTITSSSDVCVALVSGSSPPTAASSQFTTSPDGSSACFTDSSDGSTRVQVAISHGDSINAILLSIPVNENSQATARWEP
ncbi:MAG TPA: TadE/TadG family type IV pilus assembly protein [Acidimicrobiia bacterium]|nr:TadE/TadG family type IV pilus assembly protein [Acidimicrobiia bacterium]